ncbi:Ku protein [Antarcticibacterium flavum]|uniref:Non-homologous end joining protein Ku n=1 Tax=Antarcticibacterium flavum TaxID=2058175 RepID=A0A5B7X2M3_9FLAO|nr:MULTISPECIES: Ku protein [Antarcticibacterium]MCM4161636.1 Ku protein [Antarcticibacterium sp. W02-3]QCY68952.1 Ku protein [Antarcticibacterium flavum]
MRSVWNGSIQFGLVSIPVKLYSGSEDRKLDLDMLDRHDNARIRYKRVNEDTGKEVEWKDIVKGFKKGEKYVVLEKEDFEAANMKKSKTIDIEEFIEEKEVADVLFKKPYFLEPQKEGGKSYNLLYNALKKTKKLGVATFVMRQKEHLSLVGIYEKALVLHVIRFADEIRDPSDLKLPSTKVTKKEVDMAISLIDQYTTKFSFENFKDVYNDQLMKIINSKSAGKKAKAENYESKPTAAKDLMAQLKASLEKKKGKAS